MYCAYLQAIANMHLASDGAGSGFAIDGLVSKAMRGAPAADTARVRSAAIL